MSVTPVNLDISAWPIQPDSPFKGRLDGSPLNSRPDGSVWLTGVPAEEGSVITVNNNLTDADTLGSFSYLWDMDGGAAAGPDTGTTYTCLAGDVGKVPNCTISYTDGSAQAESSVSANASAVEGVGGPASWQLDLGHYETAQIPLEIISPQEGLTTGTSAPSYYYRCYTALKWRVPITVLGGAFPFKYELLTFPTGMTLGSEYGDADYGILEWVTPTVGSHSISVKVTDQEGTTDTHTWSLEVTTNMALFVDAVSGDDSTGDGSLGNPFKTMSGWMEPGADSRSLSTYDSYHVYYRAGTYYTKWDYDSNWSGTGTVPMRVKPVVHLAYPGEAVIFNIAGNGGTHPGGSFKLADSPIGGNNDIFFGTINFQGIYSQNTYQAYQQVMYWSQLERPNIFECTFDTFDGAAVGGQNPALIFVSRGSGSFTKKYLSISHNVIDGARGGNIIEIYNTEKIVLEANEVKNTISGTPKVFYAKENTKNASIRNNTGIDACNETLVVIGSSSGVYDEIEACWNNWEVTGSATSVLIAGIEKSVNMGQNYVYRNNLTGGTLRHEDTAGGGPVWYQNNVRQYDTGNSDGVTNVNPLFSVTGISTDLVATSGLVDAVTNLLTGANRTTYLGLKGHEVS